MAALAAVKCPPQGTSLSTNPGLLATLVEADGSQTPARSGGPPGFSSPRNKSVLQQRATCLEQKQDGLMTLHGYRKHFT